MAIYLDNASTTPLTEGVKEVYFKHLNEDFGNPSSIHSIGRKSRALVENARKIIAQGLNASVGEIFFTSSATESNNMVLFKCAEELGVRRIITSPTEHHCILHTLDAIKARHPSFDVVYLNVDKNGNIDLNELESFLKNSNVKTLVSLMYANNELGTIHSIDDISSICKENAALFHCDAVQVIGKKSINVEKNYFSFLSASAHKFHGPKGVGFLYMNTDNILSPLLYGGAQERNMRAGTENIHGIIAMAKAFSEAVESQDERFEHYKRIKSHFIEKLKKTIPTAQINGREEDKYTMPHIVNVSFAPYDGIDMLMFNLDIEGICASSGSACSSGIAKDSHVLSSIGHDSNRKAIRFSFSHMTTMDEIDTAMDVLKKIVRY